MKRIQPVVLVVLIKENRILLTLRNDNHPSESSLNGLWQIPGGGLEFAESPEEAAMREAREEIGVEVEIISLMPHIHTTVRGNWQGLLIAYKCRLVDDNAPININEEATDYKWCTIEEAQGLNLTPFSKIIMEEAFKTV